MRIARNFCAFVASMLFSAIAAAQSTPKQVHTSPQADPGVYSGRLKVDYPTPYEPASMKTPSADARTRARLCRAGRRRWRVLECRHGEAVTDLNKLPAEVALARTDLQILTYEWGVTYAGMLRAAEITGDTRYRAVHRRTARGASPRWPRTCANGCRPDPRPLTIRAGSMA